MTPLRNFVTERFQGWETPDWLYRLLDQYFKFDLDVCALPDTAKAPVFFQPSDNALAKRWEGVVWMNPPYSETDRWIRKAYGSALTLGSTVVCLVPANTDTAWWHDYAMRGEIWFIRGRLRFVGATSPAPFASAIVIFRASEVLAHETCLTRSVSKLSLQRLVEEVQ